jgi:hypothetical protein
MKQHATDLISLIAGILFTTLGVMFALERLGDVTINIAWIPAAVLIGLGAAGVASGVRASFDPRIPQSNDALRD